MQKHSSTTPANELSRLTLTIASCHDNTCAPSVGDKHKSRRDAANGRRSSWESAVCSDGKSKDEVLKCYCPRTYSTSCQLFLLIRLDWTLVLLDHCVLSFFDKGLWPVWHCFVATQIACFEVLWCPHSRIQDSSCLRPCNCSTHVFKVWSLQILQWCCSLWVVFVSSKQKRAQGYPTAVRPRDEKILVEQFSIDASAKAPKKLSQYNGKRMYESLQTGTNEIGQISSLETTWLVKMFCCYAWAQD
jgi:hypothetical protein